MKGKVLAILWIISVLILWALSAFLFAQIALSGFFGESTLTFEQYFTQNLTDIWVIVISLILGTFAGICIYCQYSEAEGRERRKEKKKMQSMGETTL
ncbi:MAG: hypothetical protein RTU63_01640 [Candidatus Thorarchaeota archaeon]